MCVHVFDPILRRKIVIDADLIGLAVGITAPAENKVLSQRLKVPLNSDGFFLEAHVKLRPVDFATEGIFVCGLAHYPKDVSESVAQARAAAARAMTILSKKTIEAEGKVSQVRTENCAACGACVAVCPYGAIELDEIKRAAVVNEALCKGCGACAATCRSGAIDLRGFGDEQLAAAIQAAIAE
jgi:heterodisulfide reductase subunit A